MLLLQLVQPYWARLLLLLLLPLAAVKGWYLLLLVVAAAAAAVSCYRHHQRCGSQSCKGSNSSPYQPTNKINQPLC
jgi:hypothetical protein